MNVFAKFRNFPLRINKALGIFRKPYTLTRTRTTTRTTVAGVRDAFQRLKKRPIISNYNTAYSVHRLHTVHYSLAFSVIKKCGRYV